MRSWLRLVLVLLLGVIAIGPMTGVALADGDPGSDVLVYQDLVVAADAGLSVSQQTQLSDLLKTATRAGFPIRVAIISGPSDLGAVTALWGKPEAYAKFLGYELSLAYRQRLLVVMPNGFGFNWPGHATAAATHTLSGVALGSGGTGLFAAAQSAVRALAAASGVKLAPGSGGSTPTSTAGSASATPSPAPPESI